MYNITITTADLREILVEAFRDEGDMGAGRSCQKQLV